MYKPEKSPNRKMVQGQGQGFHKRRNTRRSINIKNYPCGNKKKLNIDEILVLTNKRANIKMQDLIMARK